MTKYLTLCFALVVFSLSTSAQTSPAVFPNVDIINFGKMDDHLFRGGQPEPDDYAALKAIGIQTIIDLRNDPTSYEKQTAESLGMKYVNIPMSGWKYAKDSQVAQFMELMNDPATGVAYVHCKAGKHRTGLAGAVYRLEKYGWDYDQAYKEMKDYNYSSWPVHFKIKSYVRDYFKKNSSRIPAIRAQLKTAPAAVGGTVGQSGN